MRERQSSDPGPSHLIITSKSHRVHDFLTANSISQGGDKAANINYSELKSDQHGGTGWYSRTDVTLMRLQLWHRKVTVKKRWEYI